MNFDKRTLATLIVAADAQHQSSYVPLVYEDGEWKSGGYYALLHREAVESIVERDGLDADLIVPAQLMLHWVNDAMDWAKRVLDASEPAITPEEQRAAAEANALADEALN